MDLQRCAWVNTDPLYIRYHDEEWGVPLRGDDNALFERLTLEGAQAGLSWITILRKRENYRAAFDQFDPAIVARYDEAKIAELMANPGIVRNRLKIASTTTTLSDSSMCRPNSARLIAICGAGSMVCRFSISGRQ
jgi:DNA-3-methyladenine glycosylase I